MLNIDENQLKLLLEKKRKRPAHKGMEVYFCTAF